MLARRDESLHDFLVGHEADRDAAAMVAVVGLGHDRVAKAIRGADGVALGLDELLARHRQAERREDAVRLFLVACELDRDVRRAARDGCLDALLVLAVAELDQRLVVEPEPRDAALLGGMDERGRGGPERATLRKTDVFIARSGPVPALGHGASGAQFLRQQRAEEPECQLARGDAFLAFCVLVDDGIVPGLVRAPGLAEGHVLASDILQLERHVLEHVAEPGALVFVHAADESAGFLVGAAVLGEPG